MLSSSFERFVLDQLAELGPVTSRRMFGGAGLYSGDEFFGLIAGDALYLKVDDETRQDYEAAGMKPFKPYAGRPTTMRYYRVPLSVLESAPDLVEWARKALAAATTRGTAARCSRGGSVARQKQRGQNSDVADD